MAEMKVRLYITEPRLHFNYTIKHKPPYRFYFSKFLRVRTEWNYSTLLTYEYYIGKLYYINNNSLQVDILVTCFYTKNM